METLTQGRLRELFTLDEATGILRWRKTRANRKQGDVAGFLHRSLKTNQVYWRVKVDRRVFKRSRVVFLYVYGWLPEIVDHKDRNTLNDRPDNLRPATPIQNTVNSGVRSSKLSGLPKGVFHSQRSKRNPFLAQIRVNGRIKHLGVFPTSELAHAAYVKAAKEAWGEFACAGGVS